MSRHRIACRRGDNGFTLIELLVVAGMLSFVMAAVYSLYLTHQRSAYTQDEVVEVQQNLRIALDRIARDIHMAGIMIPPDASGTPNPPNANIATTSTTVPVGNVGNNTGMAALAGSFTDPLENVTDEIVLNMASEAHVYAYIDADKASGPLPFVFTVDTAESVYAFANNDFVRIIRPQDRNQVPSGGTLYQVTARDPVARTLTLAFVSGADPTGTSFNRGDIIARTAQSAGHPNTVRYLIVDSSVVNTCPQGQLCIARRTNEGTAAADTQIIATNIANFQLRYLLDTNPTLETTNVPDLERVRAVKIIITGRTTPTLDLAGTGTWTKDRMVTATALLRNKLLID